MYDETVKDPCRFGLADHVGEQICVRCGAVWDDEKSIWIVAPSHNQSGEVKPRPSLMNYPAKPTGLKEKINRIEVYRDRDNGRHTLALCDDGVYEIFTPDHPEHEPLFGVAPPIENSKGKS